MQPNSPQQSEAALHAVDYWQVIKNRYGVILLTLLLVFMTAAVITYVMPKKYESFARIEVKPRGSLVSPLSREFSETSGTMRMTPQFFATEFEKIKSRNALSRVVDRLDLTTKWGEDKENVLKILKNIVNTQNIRGTDLIEIRVRHTKPEDACEIAAEVARAYREYREDEETRAAQRALAELNNAVRKQEEIVEERRKVVENLVRMKGIVPAGETSFYRHGLDEDQGARLAMETYNELLSEKTQLESSIQSLLQYQNEELMAFASGLNLPENVIKFLYPQFLEEKRRLEGMASSGYGRRHPTMVSQAEVVEAMKGQLDEGVKNLRKTLEVQLRLADEKLKRFEVMRDSTRAEAIDRNLEVHDYLEAKKNFEADQALLQTLKLKEVGERITGTMPHESTIVTDDPVQARRPVSPNVTLNLVLGAVFGLIFGVGIALFLEYLDTSVKSLEDVERYLQVPVLAVIPKDVGVLHKQSGMSPDAEAYRILRTNIEFNRKNPEDNSITVVSGGAGEGKSTTLVNLAYICAQGGYTTLMIDADLRRPRLHTFFDINNSVGLTNYLTTELMLEDVILQTPVDNLYFMPSGILPADAAGILNSRRMSELIQDVKQRFDLVLVDSPPILGVSDASVLASEVDLTMIVVQHRKLPRNMLMRVKQAVENVGGHVIGVVLNNVDVRSDSQYQYYTSYYTYYAPAESQPAPASAPAGPAKQVQETAARGQDSDLY